MQITAYILLLICISVVCSSVDDKDQKVDSEKWKKKDVRDYTDADLEKLLDQWEEDEEPLPEDELPEWKRKPQNIDMSKLNMNNPEEMITATKKGKTLMIFVSVSGSPTEAETEVISKVWHSGMFNANLEVQRYVVGDNRVMFMLPDGSKAFEVKKYLVQQERCDVVTIDNQDFYGKANKKYKDEL